MNMDTASGVPLDKPAYVRFARRLQGLLIDSIILTSTIPAALMIAVAFESEHVARFLGLAVVITWLLYEPLMVSMTGSTIGHYVCNLRVVDNRRGGNVSFGKAIVRMVIKTILGLFSFLSMTVASRHQAIHDLLTGSTVQIRNLEKAKTHHFAFEREEVKSLSRVRRIAMIVIYVLGWTVICVCASTVVVLIGLESANCAKGYTCSPVEKLLEATMSLVWIGGIGLLMGLGWRGKLWGARLSAVPDKGPAAGS